MKTVMDHNFSQAPTADIPRSSFDRSHGLKTTIDAGYLYPIFWDEALPGQTKTVDPTIFARINTPLFPLMDNLYMDVHFFFVPYRQVWDNWRKFCGEQVDPGDTTDYTIPQQQTQQGQIAVGSLADYFGLPTGTPGLEFSDLPFRAYKHIWNEWYRDQNLQQTEDFSKGDASMSNYNYLLKRGKRHDYFTSCLPWLQKGDSVNLPLGSQATIKLDGTNNELVFRSQHQHAGINLDSTPIVPEVKQLNGSSYSTFNEETDRTNIDPTEYTGAYADLSSATASTVNELRKAFQIQKLLERDARSGTRYSEVVKAHFGVDFLDVTYRPEYLGGSTSPVTFQEIPYTAAQTPGSSYMGTPAQATGDLAAAGQIVVNSGGFTKSFTEHGIVIGLASVRADLTYQQGVDRFWSRETRYDFYWPALAHIGEQAVLNKEIYATGSGTQDNGVFGYQERWAEYRYKQSKITGKMRSNASSSLDAWHLSQEFSSAPSLNSTFIEENPPMDRVTAFPNEPDFHMDCHFRFTDVSPMPVFSVPGLIDHF